LLIISEPHTPMLVLIVHPNRIIQIALSKLVNSIPGCHATKALANFDEASAFLSHSEEKLDLILIEPDHAKAGSISHLVGLTGAKIIIIANDDTSAEVEGWIREGARGVLGPAADDDQLEKAMAKVSQGEYWLNRDVTSRILSAMGHAQELSEEQHLISQLTAKEKLVIKAIVNGGGQTLRETALKLNISENTVRNHLTSIYGKLGIANRLELFVFAQKFMSETGQLAEAR
jgi:two-component system nitrate/nitrite response regulator NarL